MPFENRPLFPFAAEVNERDHLAIGGCDTADLSAEFGTPLLVFDDATLRGMCRGFVDAFTARYAKSEVLYASKGVRQRRHREDRGGGGSGSGRRFRR